MASSVVVALTLIIIGSTQIGAQKQQQQQQAPPTPVFADNYHVHGLLSLPYAELNEPFNAYYDKQLERSRTDYYGGEYKVYQFGPKSTPDSSSLQYGNIYKLLYVPASFHSNKDGNKLEQVEHLIGTAYKKVHDLTTGYDKRTQTTKSNKTPVKRVCFNVKGGVGYTIQAQTVLPKLNDFTYDSTGRCPHLAGAQHRLAKCELWKFSNQVGDKKNSYKFWVKRDETNPNMTIPVHYYMLGYDSLMGSHYDRYDISYFHYQVGAARDADFKLDMAGDQCGAMPGPGFNDHDHDDDKAAAQLRAHSIVQNPIHEFVEEPHRYDHIDYHYEQFLSKFNKPMPGKGDKGWMNFLHNMRFVYGKNRELKEYKLEVNKFADANVRDLKYLRGRLHSKGYNGGLDYAEAHRNLKQGGGGDGELAKLPETFDWTVLGGVTPVKDQAVCGSCWSFGTVGTTEGAYFAKTGKLLRLSQQQLVDCSWQFGNNGCDGGEDFRAYQYIMKAGGLSEEEQYGHYKGIDGRCHDQDVEKPVKIKGFYNVTVNSVDALKHAIVNYGPVSISIDASRPTFAFYSHGAYFDPECHNDPEHLDHSVLAVGYTTINGKLVWKVKNSWSTYWGNDGYIYMLAEGNNCGVLDAPTVPIIDVN